MPRQKGTAAKAAPKAAGPKKTAPKRSMANTHPLAAPLPPGTVLRDMSKGEWVLGGHVGQGGFGLIYAARRAGEPKAKEDFVVKLEPLSNGPLFCEIHFYQRCAKEEMIEQWKAQKGVKSLGMPLFVAFGHHSHKGETCRFLVMQRFGEDLQSVFVRQNRQFPPAAVLAIGIKVLNTLEYMHDHGYAHADIKAANLLRGRGTACDEVFLVDFGLVYKFSSDGKRQPYKEDPRKRHDGTLEFCSRDAHRGVSPSPRGDLEILAFCMLQWLGGHLPWESLLGPTDKDKQCVADKKEEWMKSARRLAEACKASHIPELVKFVEEVGRLQFDATPDYARLRRHLGDGLRRIDPKAKPGLRLALDSPSVPRAGLSRPDQPSPAADKAPRGKKRASTTGVDEASPVPAKKAVVKARAARSPASTRNVKSPQSRGPKSPAARDVKSPQSRAAKSPAARDVKSPQSRAAKSPQSRAAKSPAARDVKSPQSRAAKSPAAREKSPQSRAAKSPAARGPKPPAASRDLNAPAAASYPRRSACTQTSPHMLAALKQQRRRQKNGDPAGDPGVR